MRLLAVLLAAQLCACSAVFQSTLVMSKGDIQRQLDGKFPLEKSHLLAAVTLEHPSVVLVEKSDRIGFEIDVRARLAVLEVIGRAGVSGRLQYEAGTVYLVDCRVMRLDIPGLPPERVQQAVDAVDVALAASMARVPLHQMSGPTEETMRAFIQSVAVTNGEVVIKLGL